MARMYANENFPFPVVEALRFLGHDVLTTLEAGNAGQAIPDDAVPSFATVERRVLITLNRKHFIRLHGLRPGHMGIIACTYDSDFTAQASRNHAVMVANPDATGKLLRVNRPLK